LTRAFTETMHLFDIAGKAIEAVVAGLEWSAERPRPEGVPEEAIYFRRTATLRVSHFEIRCVEISDGRRFLHMDDIDEVMAEADPICKAALQRALDWKQ